MVAPIPPPTLNIPAGSATKVSIINTTAYVENIPTSMFFTPGIPGTETFGAPSFCFLIEHPSGRKVLFDLGVRKDFDHYAPIIAEMTSAWGTKVDKDVSEILVENDIALDSIEALVWSHWHWDHIGNPSHLPSSTKLVVGPGFQKALLPGYPANPQSPIQQSDYEGRELLEVNFENEGKGIKIGRFNALDYFDDGSFYLLDAPGHAVGHLCGLARTSSASSNKKDTFIFMGADSCHHGGMMRPTEYLPIPSSISPNPLHLGADTPCPGAIFEQLQASRGRQPTEPFFVMAEGGVHDDIPEAQKTLEKLQEADASDDVLVVLAHDDSLLDIVDFFPKCANEWKAKGWGERGRWAFLKSFNGAVEGLQK